MIKAFGSFKGMKFYVTVWGYIFIFMVTVFPYDGPVLGRILKSVSHFAKRNEF